MGKVAIILAVLLVGCSMAEPPEAIMMRTHSEIRYVPDEQGRYQFPAETLSRGSGDCEDYCLLMMDRLAAAGYESTMAIIPGATPGGHAVVLCGGILYDPTGGEILPAGIEVLDEISFGEALSYALEDFLLNRRRL